MGVQTYLITAAPSTTKSHWAQDGRRFFHHEAEVLAGTVRNHSGLGRLISPRLAYDIDKAL
jgi:hypothetical protein